MLCNLFECDTPSAEEVPWAISEDVFSCFEVDDLEADGDGVIRGPHVKVKIIQGMLTKNSWCWFSAMATMLTIIPNSSAK